MKGQTTLRYGGRKVAKGAWAIDFGSAAYRGCEDFESAGRMVRRWGDGGDGETSSFRQPHVGPEWPMIRDVDLTIDSIADRLEAPHPDPIES